MSKEALAFLLILSSIAIILGFILGIIWMISVRQKTKNQFLLEMEEMKVNLRNEILQSQLEMQEQTFGSVSMEIHDNISQILSVSKLNLGLIDEASAEVMEKVKYSMDLMSRAMNDLRNLSKRLDSDLIKREGLDFAMEEYIGQLRKSVNAQIIFNIQGGLGGAGVEKELILFRILQEAINNILKHSSASEIEINLTNTEKQITLEVSDNGKGFNMAEVNASQREGSGLKNIKKRISMIQGEFSIFSTPGEGTSILVATPVDYLQIAN